MDEATEQEIKKAVLGASIFSSKSALLKDLVELLKDFVEAVVVTFHNPDAP